MALLVRGSGFAPKLARRYLSMAATATSGTITNAVGPGESHASKREGDISDSFASLSGKDAAPLPDGFRELKMSLIAGREDKVIASWNRLLKALRSDNALIADQGSNIIPEVSYADLEAELPRLKNHIRKRGAAVIRGVIPEAEARAYKDEIEAYVRANPQTRGFPTTNPQVLELYWSAPQIRARAHPNLLHTQTTLMQHLWHSSRSAAPVSLSHPLTYADRLRIRQPGDAQFALGPHMDGGSVERWERDGYGRGGVYDAVFRGEWEDLDAWDAAARVDAVTDLYGGLGACSMFRTFQGWLSMSRSGPGEGTLLVRPAVGLSVAYTLLRPFFQPIEPFMNGDAGGDARARFLEAENWAFIAGEQMTSELHGAVPGHGQEFPSFESHPHLELDRTMVHVPKVNPGDYVIWHCDTIHAVDKTHRGVSDSSVLYIPVCPTTEANAKYVGRQRAAFIAGTPGPDFPGGEGEAMHEGRPTEQYLQSVSGPAGLESMGMKKLVSTETSSEGSKQALKRSNAALGL